MTEAVTGKSKQIKYEKSKKKKKKKPAKEKK